MNFTPESAIRQISSETIFFVGSCMLSWNCIQEYFQSKTRSEIEGKLIDVLASQVKLALISLLL